MDEICGRSNMSTYYDKIAACQEAWRWFLVAGIYSRCDPRTTTFNAGKTWDKTKSSKEKNKNAIIDALPGEVEEADELLELRERRNDD